MATVNKVTSISAATKPVSDEDIQAHINAMNADGYRLVSVINLIGWFRFFWAKEQE